MRNWSSEHVRTAVNSGVNSFKHKEEALISNHPSLITGCSGRHVNPPMCTVSTWSCHWRWSLCSTTTTNSLCVNKQQVQSFPLGCFFSVLSLDSSHHVIHLFSAVETTLSYTYSHPTGLPLISPSNLLKRGCTNKICQTCAKWRAQVEKRWNIKS